jgi:hypothetical protein
VLDQYVLIIDTLVLIELLCFRYSPNYVTDLSYNTVNNLIHPITYEQCCYC